MRVFTMAAAIIFSCALANTAPAQELYENKTLGLSVQKPATWYFLSDEQHRSNISRSKMTNAEFQSLVLKLSNAPIFAISKYRDPYDDLNPSVKIIARPAGSIKPGHLLGLAKIMAAIAAKKIGKVTRVKGPKSLQFSGFPAAYVVIDFTAENQDGRQFPTTSQMWFVLKDDLIFTVGATTRQDEKTGSRQEVQGVIDTIRLQ